MLISTILSLFGQLAINAVSSVQCPHHQSTAGISNTMRRIMLLELLENHSVTDAAELAHARRFIEFMHRQPRCFERSLAEGHVTGSAWIVDPAHENVLLVHHCKLGRWLQPGGHADGDPDSLAVALREAREETGLTRLRPLGEGIFDVDVHEIPEHGGVAAHLHYDVRWLFEADPAEPLTVSAESHAVAWRPLAEVAACGVESLARMARKAMAGGADARSGLYERDGLR
jgi:8-oxo-dGTP pyrophosphatase MutT (NUDIX family)